MITCNGSRTRSGDPSSPRCLNDCGRASSHHRPRPVVRRKPPPGREGTTRLGAPIWSPTQRLASDPSLASKGAANATEEGPVPLATVAAEARQSRPVLVGERRCRGSDGSDLESHGTGRGGEGARQTPCGARKEPFASGCRRKQARTGRALAARERMAHCHRGTSGPWTTELEVMQSGTRPQTMPLTGAACWHVDRGWGSRRAPPSMGRERAHPGLSASTAARASGLPRAAMRSSETSGTQDVGVRRGRSGQLFRVSGHQLIRDGLDRTAAGRPESGEGVTSANPLPVAQPGGHARRGRARRLSRALRAGKPGHCTISRRARGTLTPLGARGSVNLWITVPLPQMAPTRGFRFE
jgi:hypothetical protein